MKLNLQEQYFGPHGEAEDLMNRDDGCVALNAESPGTRTNDLVNQNQNEAVDQFVAGVLVPLWWGGRDSELMQVEIQTGNGRVTVTSAP